jgi:ribosomal protein S18 acetylase RimI-like enzyme
LPSGLNIRPATLIDAVHLAAFVDMASRGLASYNWRLMAEAHQAPFEVGRARAMRETGDFSYRNAHIAEVDGAPAGVLIGYVLPDPYDAALIAKASEMFRPLAELESEAAGRWYINVLAVYPEYRGHGIGNALLTHADAVGRIAPKGMAIIVASQNESALKLYRRAGYGTVSRRRFTPPPGVGEEGDFLLLTKAHS